MRKLLILICVLPLLSCVSSPGKYEYHKKTPDGKVIDLVIETPTNPITPAKFSGNPDGVHEMKTGNQQEHDFVVEGITWWTTVGGILFLLVGLGVITGAGYFPFLSWHHGLYAMLTGGGLIGLPIFFDRYMWVFIPIAFLGFFIAFGDEIYRHFFPKNETG